MTKEEFKTKSDLFDKELQELYKKHFDMKTTDVIIILNDYDNPAGIMTAMYGNGCPVCAQEMLAMKILFKGLRHISGDKYNEVMNKLSKEDKNNLGYKDV